MRIHTSGLHFQERGRSSTEKHPSRVLTASSTDPSDLN